MRVKNLLCYLWTNSIVETAAGQALGHQVFFFKSRFVG